ncbi:MAG: DUF4190 domain-containing protein [Planctomycetes bacterium]|nr:DUF4190 domain-containing protein [Planctomycetota bacterium]
MFSVLCLPAPFTLLAGILALREIRRDPTKHGMGRAIFGIIMGGIGTALPLAWDSACRHRIRQVAGNQRAYNVLWRGRQ